MIDLKEFRKSNKLTQQQIADILKVTQAYISDIEKGRRPLTKEIYDKLNQYIQQEFSGLIEEPLEIYRKNQDLFIEYIVSETNTIRNYEKGDILRCKRIDFNEYIPTGIPYLFVTKLNQIHIVRYLVEKNSEYMKISDTREPVLHETVPISDIDKLFIIKEVVKKVND